MSVTPITTVSEYNGENSVLKATQLGSAFTSSQARKVVEDWCEFFASGTSPIKSLQFLTRTPKRLFDSLSGQTQLENLIVKWGDYDDLNAIASATDLRELSLRGAGKVAEVSPLSRLTSLESLVVEGFDALIDVESLGGLTRLKMLELGGKWMGNTNGHVPSIDFLRSLVNLEHLLLHSLIVDSKDYSPVLDLTRLKAVRITKVRGMKPTHEELKAALPWNG